MIRKDKRQIAGFRRNAIKVLLVFICLLATNLLMAQEQINVTGKVSSEKEGLALPGVNVSVKGSAQKALTDATGSFSISVPNAQSVLVFSYIGFISKEIAAQEIKLNVLLEEDVNTLNEVLIEVPYGVQTKASFTGSAVTLGTKELAERPRPTFQSSMQGTVAGLQTMESTGQPGAMPNVRIRGIGSYNASNSPLYVIDGVPVVETAPGGLATSSNSLGGLNPNDIETLTVLKDASATSIYGSRGANGVILITTKSGSAGKTKINVVAQQGITKISLSDKTRPLSTTEMSELLIEGILNSSINPAVDAINTPSEAYQYLIDQGLDPNVSTDWFDVITQTGSYAQYNLSASGGNEKTSFYASGGYYDQDAVTKGQGFQRTNARLSLKHTANERLSFSGRISGGIQDLSTVPGAGTGQNPIRSLYRTVPWLAPYEANGDYNPRITYNPEMVLNENVYETRIYQLLSDVSAEFKILDQLSAESKAGYDFSHTDDFRFWSPLWRDGIGSNGRGMNYTTTWNNWNITNLLKYKQQFNDFAVTATLGQEASKRGVKNISTQANNYAFEGLLTLANASEPYIAWSSIQESTLASYFLNGSINYKSKYYLNATARRDGSSRFGTNVRYGNFWSVGGAWNLDKEPFMEPLEFVNELKLRTSYGLSGNQASGYYAAQGYYTTNNNYGGQPGFAMGSIESGDLSWEKNKPFDIGVEFSLFNYRLTGSVDWYSRITSDLLMLMPVSHTNGVVNLDFNVGSFKNYGIEISLNSQNIKAESPSGFNWETNFNISTQNNKILELSQDRIIEGSYSREIGGDFYQFYMRGYSGVERHSGEALWFTNGSRTNTTVNYNEAAPFKQEGKSALSKFYGGLTNTFKYKGITLSAMLYFNWGGSIYDIWGQYTQSDGSAGVSEAGSISRVYYDNRWKQPGDVAEYPKMVYRGSQSGLVGQGSTRFLYDGSYIRLRDVSVAYDLPAQRWKLPFSSAQVYLRANNLFTYVHDKLLPYDPEVNVAGTLDQNLPISRQILLGLNVSF